MNKIYAFVIIVPFMVILMFKGVMLYEFDTKQRYIKDLVDSTAYIVKITGTLSPDTYNEIKNKLNKYSKFGDSDIILKTGVYINGTISAFSNYSPGSQLTKGDAFLIYVQSSGISNYSRIENGGVNPDDTKNLYYKAKAVCRVEYVP